MNSKKVVTKPAPEGFNPGAKAGVQENYNGFKILDSGFHRNDECRLPVAFYETINPGGPAFLFFE